MTGPAKPRRVWLRRGVIFLLLSTVTSIASFAIHHGLEQRTLHRELAAAYAATDLLDPGWRLDDLLAKRPPVPVGEDIGPLIAQAHAIQKGQQFDADPKFSETMQALESPRPMNRKQIEFLQAEFDKIPGIAEIGRQLKDRLEGRLVTKIGPDFFSTLVPHVQHARALMEVMKYDTYLRANTESPSAGLQSCVAILNLSRSMAHEPFLISFVVRCRGHAILIEAVERSLSQGEANLPTLAELQAKVEREARESEMLTGLRGERGGMMRDFQNPRRATEFILDDGVIGGRRRPPGLLDRINRFFSQDPAVGLPGYLLHMNRVVEAAKLPMHEQLDAMEQLDADVRNESMLTKLLVPSLARICKAHLRSQSQLRTLAVAIACERHRMQHKTWPESLEKLVETKLLDAVPLDPNDGQPLRYRRTAWGVVIYGVGDDRADNDGNVLHEWHEPAGTDLGFRLWDVPRRKGGTP
jgi:hypothetical protein